MNDSRPGFFSRYKGWFIAFFLIWVIMLAVLIISGDGGDLPFQYQVF